MGYNHAAAFLSPDLALSRGAAEYLMSRAVQRFLDEHPKCEGMDFLMELDEVKRTVLVIVPDAKCRITYSFDALV